MMFRATKPRTPDARPEPRFALPALPALRARGLPRVFLLLTALAAALLAGCGEQAPDGVDRAGPDAASPAGSEGERGAASAAQLAFADGSTLPADAFEGSWLFVNYWAEWCAPCLEEIPELNELEHEVDDARVLGINFDGLEAAVIREQMETLGIAFPVAVGDAGAALGLQPPEVLPSTYVFDPQGVQRGVLRGPQTLDMLRAAMGPAAADS